MLLGLNFLLMKQSLVGHQGLESYPSYSEFFLFYLEFWENILGVSS